MSVQQFANALYSNGANPSGALTMEGKLIDAQLDRLSKQFRWQSWKIAVEAGILSPDEVRAEEGWNPGPPKAPPVSVT